MKVLFKNGVMHKSLLNSYSKQMGGSISPWRPWSIMLFSHYHLLTYQVASGYLVSMLTLTDIAKHVANIFDII